MNVHRLRYTVGTIILLGHFAAAILYLWLVSSTTRPDVWDFMGGVTAIVPFTLLYASVFYRYVVSNPTGSTEAKETPVDFGPFVIQVCMVSFFIICLIGAMFVAFENRSQIGGIEKIPVILGGVDTLFAVFVSMTFSTLFPLEWETQKSKSAVAKANPNEDPE